MAEREWQPGDVAMHSDNGLATVSGRCDRHFADGPHWHYQTGGWDHLHGYIFGSFRPLVVIDAEDRDQVERLSSLIEAAGGPRFFERGVTALAAALREFANPTPPKPEEPLGLGAVVEDAEGELWVRDKTTTTTAHWKRARGQMGGKRVRYAELDVVRVLSEGIQQ